VSIRLPALCVALAWIGCNGPFLLLPGGKLSGEVAPTPADWSFAGNEGTAQLETRPEEPYSVNIAYTVIDGALYINAGGTQTRWVRNLTTDPRVRLRLGDALYDARAERVHDLATLDAFGEAWTSQSFFRRDPRKLEEVWLYRVVAR
jgi:hypothetical protein